MINQGRLIILEQQTMSAMGRIAAHEKRLRAIEEKSWQSTRGKKAVRATSSIAFNFIMGPRKTYSAFDPFVINAYDMYGGFAGTTTLNYLDPVACRIDGLFVGDDYVIEVVRPNSRCSFDGVDMKISDAVHGTIYSGTYPHVVTPVLGTTTVVNLYPVAATGYASVSNNQDYPLKTTLLYVDSVYGALSLVYEKPPASPWSGTEGVWTTRTTVNFAGSGSCAAVAGVGYVPAYFGGNSMALRYRSNGTCPIAGATTTRGAVVNSYAGTVPPPGPLNLVATMSSVGSAGAIYGSGSPTLTLTEP